MLHTNANTLLKDAVQVKWPADAQKEWWYSKLAAVRRTKLLRCCEQQGYRCCYCGAKTWHPSYGESGPNRKKATLEHVVPRSQGGTDSMNNLAMACASCNNMRGDNFEALVFYEMVQNSKDMRRPSCRKEKSPEQLAKEQESHRVRHAQFLFSTAFVLTVVNRWDWWDLWYQYASEKTG